MKVIAAYYCILLRMALLAQFFLWMLRPSPSREELWPGFFGPPLVPAWARAAWYSLFTFMLLIWPILLTLPILPTLPTLPISLILLIFLLLLPLLQPLPPLPLPRLLPLRLLLLFIFLLQYYSYSYCDGGCPMHLALTCLFGLAIYFDAGKIHWTLCSFA